MTVIFSRPLSPTDVPEVPDRPAMGLGARLAHRAVRGYQRVVADRPTPCRYLPTCSCYALDAYEEHGFVRGSWLTLRRLGRCHPWGGQGWDPVPRRVRKADRCSI